MLPQAVSKLSVSRKCFQPLYFMSHVVYNASSNPWITSNSGLLCHSTFEQLSYLRGQAAHLVSQAMMPFTPVYQFGNLAHLYTPEYLLDSVSQKPSISFWKTKHWSDPYSHGYVGSVQLPNYNDSWLCKCGIQNCMSTTVGGTSNCSVTTKKSQHKPCISQIATNPQIRNLKAVFFQYKVTKCEQMLMKQGMLCRTGAPWGLYVKTQPNIFSSQVLDNRDQSWSTVRICWWTAKLFDSLRMARLFKVWMSVHSTALRMARLFKVWMSMYSTWQSDVHNSMIPITRRP